ncbi:MAG: prolipoprotein diacylglyceryl transferase [Bryobacteraceae bacterium]|nr:prolipoprotein diacylglyceryl transferase [Bryobacteraceae bacterium]
MFPKIVEIGPFYLPAYGALVALGFLAGLAVTSKLAKRRRLDPEKISNLAIYCAIAGLLGAKLLMFAFDWELYAKDPSRILSLETLQSAGVYQGGFVVAFAFGWWWMKRNGLAVLPTLDLFAPGIALGHAVGRLGCFAAGCCWGAKCDRPWAVTFTKPDANDMTGVPLNVPLHPTQLYESVAELAIFAALWVFANRNPRPGSAMGLYLVLYSAVRFFVEFYRVHLQDLPFGGPWSLTQWIAVAMAAAGLWMMAKAPRHANG